MKQHTRKKNHCDLVDISESEQMEMFAHKKCFKVCFWHTSFKLKISMYTISLPYFVLKNGSSLKFITILKYTYKYAFYKLKQ